MREKEGSPAWVWRLRHGIVCLAFAVFALNTDSGRAFNDTKLDLILNPAGFMAKALHLWDPAGSAGQMQNQAYGYLFPMGPFFWIASAAGLPSWVIQRLWWALLLSVSYLGFVRLARLMGFGSPANRMVGGVAYALAPHVLTIIGRSSVEVWPPALSPWVIIPLLSASRGGSARRAAAWSGLAVLAMGGVNAAVNLAAVLPAALWLLTREWDRALVKLGLWWIGALTLATTWWVVPLLALGRYSPPFLSFIESASITTRTTSMVESLRGTAAWVAYIPGSGSQAGLALLTEPVLIASTVVLVMAGLAGLSWTGAPERPWLLAVLFTGVALVTLGHLGEVHGLFASNLQTSLDGPLAAIRNVHKFGVLIRLALAAGLVLALERLSRGRTANETAFLRRVVTASGAFAVVAGASPFLGLGAAPTRSFSEVPAYWSQAGQWLSAHAQDTRTLLLPGSRFANYTWGYTGDEPLQALSDGGWDIRNAVPLTGPGHVRWLDGLERRFATGLGGADLTSSLTEGGIGYVLVRNDLSYGPEGATRPVVVRAALAGSPGIQKVASFGPLVGGGGDQDSAFDAKLNVAVAALELYRVGGQPPVRAAVLDLKDVAQVVGGAEAWSRPDGIASPGIMTREDTIGVAGGRAILTDTPLRREMNIGTGTFGASATLAMTDPLRLRTPTRDYGADDSPGAEATALMVGGERLSASSSAGDATNRPTVETAAGPFAAFDDSLRTAWRPASDKSASGSWLQVAFPDAVDLQGGRVLLDRSTGVRWLSITTDRGTTRVLTKDDVVSLPAGRTSTLRLTIGQITGGAAADASAGIRNVGIPGLRINRTIHMPTTPLNRLDAVVIRGDIGRPGCVLVGERPLCTPTLTKVGEDSAGLDRTFVSPSEMVADVRVRARWVGSDQMGAELASTMGLPLRAAASSQAVTDIAASPLAAIDHNLGTAWIADHTDPDPQLRLSWQEPTALTSLQVLLDEHVAAARATSVTVVSSTGDRREAAIDAHGYARFESMTTDGVTVHLQAAKAAQSVDPYTLETTELGVGVSEVRVVGVSEHPSLTPSGWSRVVELQCGEGPDLVVAGLPLETRVSTTVGALFKGQELTALPCGSNSTLNLPAGPVRVQAGAGDVWDVSGLVLERSISGSASPPRVIPSRIVTWSSDRRALEVSARAEPALLRVGENENSGWTARADGQVLEPVVVDGWQQGWVLPEGPATSVLLTFEAEPPVRLGMFVGGLFAALLLLGALWPSGVGTQVRGGGRNTLKGVAALAVACLALVGGWWSTGVLASLAVFMWAFTRKATPSVWQSALAVASSSSYGIAGLVLLSGPYASGHYRADAGFTQILCLTALGTLLLSMILQLHRGQQTPRVDELEQ